MTESKHNHDPKAWRSDCVACTTHPEAQGNKDLVEPPLTRLEEERLAEIEARLRAASPGPWTACGVVEPGELSSVDPTANILPARRHENGACSCGYVFSEPADAPVVEAIGGPWGDRYPAIRLNGDGSFEAYQECINYGEVPREIQAANMKFIAAAPTDIADLLAEVKQLRLLVQAQRSEAAPTSPQPIKGNEIPYELRAAVLESASRWDDLATITEEDGPYTNVGFMRASAKRLRDALPPECETDVESELESASNGMGLR